MLKNYMEDIVEQLLPIVLQENKGCCTCESCLLDIKAIALNNLPPRYFVSEQGNVFIKIDKSDIQSMTDIVKEITKAVAIVTKNPKH